MFSEKDKSYMQLALQLAKQAELQQEVPIGAVLVLNDEMIGEGFNQPISSHDPTAHAEVMALRDGAKKIKNYRLTNTTLYVTLEPCIMCVGSIVHARVKRVVFGAYDPKKGAVESVFKAHENQKLNHEVIYEGGLLKEECGKLLVDFFKNRR